MEKSSPIYLAVLDLGEVVGVVADVVIFGHRHVLQLCELEAAFEMHHIQGSARQRSAQTSSALRGCGRRKQQVLMPETPKTKQNKGLLNG